MANSIHIVTIQYGASIGLNCPDGYVTQPIATMKLSNQMPMKPAAMTRPSSRSGRRAWLRGRHALAAVLGAVAGPASYFAGQKLGAIQFVEPTAALTSLAIGWAVIMPVLMLIAERLDGFQPVPVKEA